MSSPRLDDLDVSTRFERLVAAPADRAREAREPRRGPPLDDVAGEPFAAAEIRRVEELRLSAVELAIDLDLRRGPPPRGPSANSSGSCSRSRCGRHLHRQRMLALYRSGRQADALEAYRHARATLVERMGVEPALELVQAP